MTSMAVILALPLIVGFCIQLVIFLIALTLRLLNKPVEVKNAHVLITGGSSGIGKEVAIEAIKMGANVSIVARNADKLKEVVDLLTNNLVNPEEQKVAYASVDVSGSVEDIRASLKPLTDQLGPVKVLIHCAGFSAPGRAHQVPEADVRRMTEVNYLGSVMVTQALLPDMMASRNGAIIFTSSLAGLAGVYGLAAYCGSKFAIRGYAEALGMEVAPYGIRVSVNCPPDTDTPGFEEENKTKPEETKLISEGAGLFQPNIVAKTLLQGGLKGKFLTSNGLDGWMLTNLTSGMADADLMDILTQASLLGLLRFVAWGYRKYFGNLIQKCHRERGTNKT